MKEYNLEYLITSEKTPESLNNRFSNKYIFSLRLIKDGKCFTFYNISESDRKPSVTLLLEEVLFNYTAYKMSGGLENEHKAVIDRMKEIMTEEYIKQLSKMASTDLQMHVKKYWKPYKGNLKDLNILSYLD